MSKTIGILGGMGPAATMDLFRKIILNTPAKTDQEHFRIIIYNNPKIPPRKHTLSQTAVSPLTELIKTALALEQAGADFIIMPCATAHIWFKEIEKVLTIPFYNMIENTFQTMLEQKKYTDGRILLLATETAINNGLYQNAFNNSPFEIVIPSVEEQKVVDQVIDNVKAGEFATNPYINELNKILKSYQIQDITTLLGGCTELPLMFPYIKVQMDMIDPILMLARMSIQKAQ